MGKLFPAMGGLVPFIPGLLLVIQSDDSSALIVIGILLMLFGAAVIFASFAAPDQSTPTATPRRRTTKSAPVASASRPSATVKAAGTVAASIDAMSGVQFERHVADIIRNAGYQVTTTRATGDFGVDLIAERNHVRIAVQCKRQAKPVGAAAVQQVVAGAVMHKCTETMVVSNQYFTSAAQRLAEQHGCVLVGVTGLTQLLFTIR